MHTSYLYPLRLRGGYICYIIKPVTTYVVKTKHAWGQAFFMGFLLFLSDFMVPLIIFYIVGFAILGKRPVFDDFLYGAKEGMQTVVQVLPSLVGLMTAVGVLRASGFLEFLTHILEVPATSIGLPGPIIPIAFIRLVSNSAGIYSYGKYGNRALLYECLFRFCRHQPYPLYTCRRTFSSVCQPGSQCDPGKSIGFVTEITQCNTI